jgi:hypothetical protein
MMRPWLLLALAGCLLAGTAEASAEAPTPGVPRSKITKKRLGKMPFRVVKLLPETGQVLVYDQERHAHVLVAEGEVISGFTVVEVDEDSLVVARDGRELVLIADPRAPQLAPGVAPAVLDPYAATAPTRPARVDGGLRPIDPYAPAPVREVLAPATQRESLRSADVVDPYAPPTEPRVVVAPREAGGLKPTPAPGSPSAPDPIRAGTLAVKRAELEAALSDFTGLGRDIGFVRLPRGVRLGKVASTSYFWKLGLRDGDIVTAIDGKPLRTLDDAASAYARLGSAKALTVDVERGSARGTLRFALR